MNLKLTVNTARVYRNAAKRSTSAARKPRFSMSMFSAGRSPWVWRTDKKSPSPENNWQRATSRLSSPGNSKNRGLRQIVLRVVRSGATAQLADQETTGDPGRQKKKTPRRSRRDHSHPQNHPGRSRWVSNRLNNRPVTGNRNAVDGAEGVSRKHRNREPIYGEKLLRHHADLLCQ